MATAKKPVPKKKPAKKAKAGGNDAQAVLKRMQQKRSQNPDSCIFC
jgi:hypothetical protein